MRFGVGFGESEVVSAGLGSEGGIEGPMGFLAGSEDEGSGGMMGPIAGAGPVSESESERSISSAFFADVGGIVGPIEGSCDLGQARAGPGALGP